MELNLIILINLQNTCIICSHFVLIKKKGKPTIVFFHVTVMSLDSIDESSMVSVSTQDSFFFLFSPLHVYGFAVETHCRISVGRILYRVNALDWVSDVHVKDTGLVDCYGYTHTHKRPN